MLVCTVIGECGNNNKMNYKLRKRQGKVEELSGRERKRERPAMTKDTQERERCRLPCLVFLTIFTVCMITSANFFQFFSTITD